MNMKYSLISALIFLMLSCGKRDEITKKSINGRVVNTCTDKGFAHTSVFFEVFKNNETQIEKRETTSDANGNFSFVDVNIHSLDEYSYAIHIPSKSGIGTGAIGINGTTMYFGKNESDIFLEPRVTPKFLYFCMDFAPNTVFDQNDSINVHVEQKIFHKNVPDLPYEWTIGDYGIKAVNCSNNYPMGLWNITIRKWKNNVYSMVEDSIFLDFADTKTYIVNW